MDASPDTVVTVVTSPRRRVAWYLTVSGVVLIASAVGLAAFGGFARHSFQVGPARLSAFASPSLSPGTTVSIPPFGSITADTHVTPLALRISLEEVDIPALEAAGLNGMPGRDVLDSWAADVRRGLTRAIAKGLLAAFVAGAFAGWALKRGWRWALSSALAGLVVPALLTGATMLALDLNEFRTPTFRGAVSYAPSLIALVQQRAQKVESLRDQVSKLVGDLARYYQAPQSFASAGALDGTYRVLHVTDLHLDPVGLELARELAVEFRASLVIDTGDINHYGSSTEAAFVASQVPTSVPQLFVPGNHDSPAILAALDALPHVTVLGDAPVNVDGLVVLGVADPSSAGMGVESDGGRLSEIAGERASLLAAALEAGEATPTILAIHHPGMAEPFEGLVPLIIAGHSHTPVFERRGETWYLNSGTTGGVHFSTMRAEPHIPHSASVLYYTGTLPRQLVAVDQIEVFGLAGQSSVRRTVTNESLLR